MGIFVSFRVFFIPIAQIWESFPVTFQNPYLVACSWYILVFSIFSMCKGFPFLLPLVHLPPPRMTTHLAATTTTFPIDTIVGASNILLHMRSPFQIHDVINHKPFTNKPCDSKPLLCHGRHTSKRHHWSFDSHSRFRVVECPHLSPLFFCNYTRFFSLPYYCFIY